MPSLSVYDSLIVQRRVANGGPSLLPPYFSCEIAIRLRAAQQVSLAGFANPFQLGRFL